MFDSFAFIWFVFGLVSCFDLALLLVICCDWWLCLLFLFGLRVLFVDFGFLLFFVCFGLLIVCFGCY